MHEATKAQPHLTITGTIDDVLAWVDKMGQRGMYNSSTARFKRNAIEQFVSILGPDEPHTAVYVKDNIDLIAKRWATKENANPETARTYRSRALGAVTDYLNFQEDPSSFKPKSNASRSSAPKKATKVDKAAAATESMEAPVPEPQKTATEGTRPGGAEQRTFPLGKEREPFAYVLPEGMMVSDVIKIACHLVTLAEDFDPMNAKTAAVFSLARRDS